MKPARVLPALCLVMACIPSYAEPATEYLGDSLQQAAGGQFTWGLVAEGIGCFSVDSMEGYTLADATLRDSHRLVDRIMDRVIVDLSNARGIIVDARWRIK